MNWIAFAVAAPSLGFLLLGCVPSNSANRHIPLMRVAASFCSILTFLLSIVAAGSMIGLGKIDYVLATLNWPIPISLGVYLDSLSMIMMVLIALIGAIIVRYSIRYLDREPNQGRFLKWMLFTLGSVILLVVSRNLVMFTAAWMLTSLGLHQLLTHYSQRPWAIWAARKKFLISRLGDVLLLAAMVLTYNCLGSVEYTEIFAALSHSQEQAASPNPWIPVISSLYVLGAMTKSAQFPFHSWLPDTMEAPTPVSAFMHAGIINAGGFLILRLSPLIVQSHLALDFLAVIGAFTALQGGLVMLTQTSVKRQLAYSTIAQMGFMMLQCGLGAFSTALLHIVAHSIYKAYAFLRSGSVLDSTTQETSLRSTSVIRQRESIFLPLALFMALTVCSFTLQSLFTGHSTRPGDGTFRLILTIAITQLLWPSFSSKSMRLAGWGVLAAMGLTAAYFTLDRMSDQLLLTSVSHQILAPSLLDNLITSGVCLGFIGLFVVQLLSQLPSQSALMRRLYVHAIHGFYLDVPARRITAWAWGQRGPAP